MTDKYTKRFWSKVAIGEPHECWEWTAGKDANSYGRILVRSHNLHAHRVAWRLTFGAIPDGLCVCHHCDNPDCCNPYHLFLGSMADNMADRDAKGRQARGSRNGNSKFTEEDIPAIRTLLKDGATQADIARMYGVGTPAISDISTGRRWGWLQ